MNLYKFYNTKPLGKVPEYCNSASASVVARTEEKARQLLFEFWDDELFLDKTVSKLGEEIDLSEEQIIDWETDS